MSEPLPNLFTEFARFRELCERLGSDVDLTDASVIDALLEGETQVKEIVAALLEDLDENDILVVGLSAKIEAFKARLESFKLRNEGLRRLIGQAMDLSPDKTLRMDSATITMAKGRASVRITDQSRIPFDYMVQPEAPDPRPDKEAILADLTKGVTIDGAELNNPAPQLRIKGDIARYRAKMPVQGKE
jgi:hypothetical protein